VPFEKQKTNEVRCTNKIMECSGDEEQMKSRRKISKSTTRARTSLKRLSASDEIRFRCYCSENRLLKLLISLIIIVKSVAAPPRKLAMLGTITFL
jgi:redox-regulated HSP33 family molecular chaperone